MRVSNIVGSLFYSGVGYMVLVKKYFFGIDELSQFYIYSAVFFILYLVSQAVGIAFSKSPGDEKSIGFDIIFSSIPLFVAFESYIKGSYDIEFFTYFRLIYTIIALFDIVIFTIICIKYTRISNGLSKF